ncbi:MAG TPA: preprotein translocase subunit SecY [archaeon]|nr:preprotein translocase subunit SecY [archaeon]
MSVLEALKPIYSLLPEVKTPEEKQTLKKRLIWTGVILLIFFLMGNIQLIGISGQSLGGQLESAQIVLALKIGTLISAGIGPIVLASIILQLLIGGGLIKLDLSNPAEKAQFSGTQKLLAIVLSFVEGFFYLAGGLLVAEPGMFLFVLLQMAFGSILLLYMDEVVSKYGIGSGIGLFIAGGVAEEIFWRAFSPLDVSRNITGLDGSGLVFVFIREIGSSIGSALVAMLPIIFTLVVFFVVVYAEGIHVNIPITMGARGTGGRYPVKFLYVSNMPVILAAALFANIQIWATLVKGRVPILENIIGGLAAIVSAPTQLVEKIFLEGLSPEILNQIVQSITTLQFVGLGGEIIHGFLYIIVLTILCIVFGKFWIELGGQGSERVAAQLDKAGMSIPGFRRDPRVIKQVLDRYIPTITILGSAFVGILAGFADLTGALGTGTGILLTVGIVYRLYEELAKQQLAEMHPMLGAFFGG